MGKLFALSAVVFLLGCASEDKHVLPGMEELDGGSNARGPAYVTDQFNVRRPLPKKDKKWQPMEFYYKHCSKMDEPLIHYPNRLNYECESRFF